ncbi:MAG: type II toxin-antitoxin system VapC family toxin [Candidatus Micrarchaeaceae archaeon]
MYCLDASVIVNSVVEREPLHEFSMELMEYIDKNRILVVFPNIVIPEVASAVSRGTGSSANAKSLIRSLIEVPNFIFIPIDKELSVQAAELAAEYKLRGADSLYVAVAHQYGCKLISLDDVQRDNSSKLIDTLTPKEELNSLQI